MSPKFLLLALLSVTGTAFVLFLLFGQKRLIPLSPLATPPRPPVVANKESRPQLLSSLHDAFPEEGVEDVENAKRRARNKLAEQHAEALENWKQGRISLRKVEAIEQMLIVARERVGEVDKREMHEQLAALFEREVRRLEGLEKSGFAGADQVERARLFLARELYMGGRAGTDSRAAAYPEKRVKYLEALKREHDTLVDQNLGKRSYLDLEYKDVLDDFPEPPTPPPAPPTDEPGR